MKNSIKMMVMAMFSMLSVSCAVGPTAKLADGSIVTLGGSLATKASADARSLTLPNGFSMNWVRGNVDETEVPKMGIMMAGAVGIAKHTAASIVSNNGAKNVAAKEATKQVGIKTAGEVDKAAIAGAGVPATTSTSTGLTTAPVIVE